MKRFREHSKKTKFCWAEGDLEHHNVLDEKTTTQKGFTPKYHHSEESVGQFAKHGSSLDSTTKSYINRYKIDSYPLNSRLRKNAAIAKRDSLGASHSAPMVEHLDKATSFKMKKPLTVYRGTTGKHSAEKFKTIGHEFTDHGYTSASTNHHIAREFTEGGGNDDHLFAIHLKPGDKAHHFDYHVTAHNRENEVVLHRGTRFRITGHTIHEWDDPKHGSGDSLGHSKTKITHLEVVHQKPRAVKLK
jgi:hypothetical protein